MIFKFTLDIVFNTRMRYNLCLISISTLSLAFDQNLVPTNIYIYIFFPDPSPRKLLFKLFYKQLAKGYELVTTNRQPAS